MSATIYHDLVFHELRSDTGIFHTWRDRVRLRERYEPYVCPKCGKFDPREALKAGFDEKLGVERLTFDGFATRDNQVVLSAKLFKAIEKRLGADGLLGFPIPRSSLLVAFPKRVITVDSPEAGKGRASVFKSVGRRCSACDRPKEMGVAHYRFKPLPEGAHLAGLWVESLPYGCPIVAWPCDDVVKDAFPPGRWKGIRFSKGFYGPNAPFWKRGEDNRKRQTPKNNSWLKLLNDDGLLDA